MDFFKRILKEYNGQTLKGGLLKEVLDEIGKTLKDAEWDVQGVNGEPQFHTKVDGISITLCIAWPTIEHVLVNASVRDLVWMIEIEGDDSKVIFVKN